jgi:hypothetical protein
LAQSSFMRTRSSGVMRLTLGFDWDLAERTHGIVLEADRRLQGRNQAREPTHKV